MWLVFGKREKDLSNFSNRAQKKYFIMIARLCDCKVVNSHPLTTSLLHCFKVTFLILEFDSKIMIKESKYCYQEWYFPYCDESTS